jgi:hypothetical protein
MVKYAGRDIKNKGKIMPNDNRKKFLFNNHLIVNK